MSDEQGGGPLADILIVDDDPEVLRLLIHLLRQQGYKVRPATDGPQGLAAARLARPDLILLDVMLSKMSGYEVCEALKADEATRDIPVIFISSLNQVLDKVRAFSVGGVDYINKPFQIEEVLARVKTHLALYQLQTTMRQTNQQLQHEIDQRKRIESALWQRNQELLVLQAIGEVISSRLDIPHVLKSVAGALQNLLDIQGCTIFEWHRDRNVLSAIPEQAPTYDLNQHPLRLKVLVEQKPVQVHTGQSEADPAELALLQEVGDQALLMVPMISNGETLGLIELSDCRAERPFTETEITLAQLLANQAATAVQNARLYQQAQQEISERKAVEARLRESEERYRSVVEDQTDMISRYWPDGTLTFVNDAYCRYFGKSSAELVGQKWQPLAAAEDLPDIEAGLSTLSPDNPVVIIENRDYYLSGEVRWMQFVNGGFFDEVGQLVEIQAVGRDVTARKQAELLLQETNDSLQERIAELVILHYIAQTLTTVTDIEATLHSVVHLVNLLFNTYSAGVSLFDPASEEIRVVVSLGRLESDSSGNAPANEDDSGLDEQNIAAPLKLFRARLLQERRSLSISHVQTSPALTSVRHLFRTRHIQSLLLVPLQVLGKVIGFLTLAADRPEHEFTPDEERLADTIAGQLAGAIKIAQLFEEEHRQRQLAESLRQVATILSSSLDQPTILNIIFEQLQQVLRYDGASIGLIEDDELVIAQAVGRSVWHLDYRLPLKGENCLTQVLQQRQVVILTNMAEAESWPTWYRPHEPGSWMGTRLEAGRTVFGLLVIERDQVGDFRQKDAEILQTFAHQAAAAIENARLYVQAQAVAIDAERQRLARDLHDSVTQSLYSLTLLTNGWATMAQRGELDVLQVAKQFKQLEELSLNGLKEMRLLLHQLRPPILEDLGLVGALQHRLDTVEQRVNVKTRLLVHGAVDELSPALEEQLFAIAQETLTNTLRHAEATEVIVLLRREDERLIMSVTDNGIGFDPSAPSFGLGLASIRERSEAIGGQVEITSAPQQGTMVMITISLRPEEGYNTVEKDGRVTG
jgi:PAS domain S-box-containing protein